MAVEKGSAFLLKVGNGAAPVVYATVAGLRTTQLSVNGEPVVVTTKDSGGWRELLSGAGVRHVSVSGAGVFTGSAAETRIRGNALSGVLDDYRLSFESGETMTGRFARDVAAMRGELEGVLGTGAERAAARIETALLRAVRSGKLGFEELKAVALAAMDAIARRALEAGVQSVLSSAATGSATGGQPARSWWRWRMTGWRSATRTTRRSTAGRTWR